MAIILRMPIQFFCMVSPKHLWSLFYQISTIGCNFVQNAILRNQLLITISPNLKLMDDIANKVEGRWVYIAKLAVRQSSPVRCSFRAQRSVSLQFDRSHTLCVLLRTTGFWLQFKSHDRLAARCSDRAPVCTYQWIYCTIWAGPNLAILFLHSVMQSDAVIVRHLRWIRTVTRDCLKHAKAFPTRKHISDHSCRHAGIRSAVRQ